MCVQFELGDLDGMLSECGSAGRAIAYLEDFVRGERLFESFHDLLPAIKLAKRTVKKSRRASLAYTNWAAAEGKSGAQLQLGDLELQRCCPRTSVSFLLVVPPLHTCLCPRMQRRPG
jgi:hypothetical protein